MKEKIFFKSVSKIIGIFFLVMSLGLSQFGMTGAWFISTLAAEDSSAQAGTLDLTLSSGQTNFVPDTLLPGEDATRNGSIENVGSLSFEFNQEYQFVSGNSDLCAALQLEVVDEASTIVYSGSLAGFTYNSGGTLSSAQEENYEYLVTLPSGADASLGSQSCSFKIVAKAWQVGGSYGSGFWDTEALTNTINSGSWAWVKGQKFNDQNGNGVKNLGEMGLEDWTVYAGVEVDDFPVNSNGAPVTSAVLENDQKYFVRVSGTFWAGDNITADAKYSVRAPNTDWTDSVQNYESYGPSLLDLQVDGTSPNWGTFNDDHIYWLTLTGSGVTKEFQIYDIYYPNNVGSLNVTIYRVVAEDQTDSNGDYELDLSGVTGTVIVAEETQDDWIQTLPSSPNGHYAFNMPAKVFNQNFGNHQVEEQAPPIVLNEIMYNPLGDENGTMPNGEWVELYNNADYDIDVAGWTIKDVVGYTSSHDITISTSNSDNDLDTSDGGETVVPAGGWLVVYRNGKGESHNSIFNDNGDTVQLYDNFNNLIDSHTYDGGKVKGTSEARIPDGTGDWVDPLPTPGRKNVLEQSQLEPQVKIYQQDANNSKIGIFDALNYHQAKCDVYYFHQEEGMVEPIQENVKKETTINGLETFIIDIYMGTESKGVYTPHHNITNVSLECVLSGGSISDRTLTADLEGSWTQ